MAERFWKRFYIPGMISILGILIIGFLWCSGAHRYKRCLTIQFHKGDIELDQYSCRIRPDYCFPIEQYHVTTIELNRENVNALNDIEKLCSMAIAAEDSLFVCCVATAGCTYDQIINLWDYCRKIEQKSVQHLNDSLWIYPVTKTPSIQHLRYSTVMINHPASVTLSGDESYRNGTWNSRCIPYLVEPEERKESILEVLDINSIILILLWIMLAIANVHKIKRFYSSR